MTDPPKKTQRWRTQEILDVTATNERTGELIELGTVTGMVPVAPKRPKNRREIKFAMIDMQAMPKLKMSKGEWSLFWLVVSYTDLERGEARIATGELSRELGWAGPNTSRALSRLAERNILIKEGPGVWRANPRLLARGVVEKWETRMAEAPAVDWDGE